MLIRTRLPFFQKHSLPSHLPVLSLCAVALLTPFAKAQNISGWTSGVAKISPGTIVDFEGESGKAAAADSRFNRLLYLGKPELNHGDFDSVSGLIRDNAGLFSFTIMASVQKTSSQPDATYRLGEVGLGFSLPIKGRVTIIDYASAERLGANLGLIQNQVLSRNEANFLPPNVLARTTTMLLFDGKGHVAVNGKNEDRLIRHLVWVNPKSGNIATGMWILRPDSRGGAAGVETAHSLRLVAPGTQETRPIFVDGNEFTFTIPSDKAFGLADLPSGLSVNWTPELEAQLGKPDYDLTELSRLISTMNDIIVSSAG